MSTDAAHHFPDEMLLDYATGALGESWALAVAVHAESCEQCRSTIGMFDHVGGALIEEAPAAEISDTTRAACMAAIDEPSPPAAAILDEKPKAALPAILRQLLGADLDGVKWSAIGGGIKQRILRTSDSATARLLYIPAGFAPPWHSHRGNEATVVLAGGFYDGELCFTKGDVEFTDTTEPHQPRAMDDQPCITLAVTEAPLRFVNFLPRLVQPFAKI